jgi:hypothetical protein
VGDSPLLKTTSPVVLTSCYVARAFALQGTDSVKTLAIMLIIGSPRGKPVFGRGWRRRAFLAGEENVILQTRGVHMGDHPELGRRPGSASICAVGHQPSRRSVSPVVRARGRVGRPPPTADTPSCRAISKKVARAPVQT